MVNPKVENSNNIKLEFNSGIPQDPILGPIICNIVLDGLQDFVQNNLPSKYTKSKEELRYLKFKTGIKLMRPVLRSQLQIFCIRYLDNILILSRSNKLLVKTLQYLLIEFLDKKGLKIKNSSIFQGKRFKPGSSINYLGFKFKYPNLNQSNFDKGKYTKFNVNSNFFFL